jgi:transposase
MHERGCDAKFVAECVGVGLSTLYRWFKDSEVKPRCARGSKLDKSADFMRNILLANPKLTCDEIRELLFKTFEIKASRQLVNAYVLHILDFPIKRLKIRGGKPQVCDQQCFIQEVDALPSSNVKWFLDEQGHGTRQCRTYGRAPKGETPTIVMPKIRGPGSNLLMAISSEGDKVFHTTSKEVDGPIFARFVKSLPLSSSTTLFLDNASIHSSDAACAVFAEKGCNVEYIPSYSPELNPTENVFSIIKARFLRKRLAGEIDDVDNTVKRLASEVTVDQILGCVGNFEVEKENLRQRLGEIRHRATPSPLRARKLQKLRDARNSRPMPGGGILKFFRPNREDSK